MATETTNYHFIKPADTDPVDNTPLNQNFDSIDAAIADHVADTNNPHQVTKEQVGLGNVDNVSAKDVLAELVDSGAKNLIQNAATSRTENGVTFTVNADGTVSLTGTASATIWFPIMTNMTINSGTYTISNGLADDTARVIISTTNSLSSRIFDSNESGYITKTIDSISGVNAYLRVASGKVTDGTVVKPMLCTKAAWDISQAYVPYRPSYDELVARKDILAELVDSGTKNLMQNTANTATLSGVTFTKNSDGSVTITGTASSSTGLRIVGTQGDNSYSAAKPLPRGVYVIYPSYTDNTLKRFGIGIFSDENSERTVTYIYNTPITITVDNDTTRYDYTLAVSSGQVCNGEVLYPMLCTKAAWDISQAYVPYRPGYDEIVARIEALEQAAGISVRSVASLTAADATETEGGEVR